MVQNVHQKNKYTLNNSNVKFNEIKNTNLTQSHYRNLDKSKSVNNNSLNIPNGKVYDFS